METAVGVSAASVASVAGIPVGKGGGVSVGGRGGEVGAGEEQEEMRERKRTDERIRDVMCWGMQAILTEIIYLPRRHLRNIQYYERLAYIMHQDILEGNAALPHAAEYLQHTRVRLDTA